MTLRYHTPLNPDEQRRHGITEPQILAMADRVRFAELDTLNHVNNKSYMTWFESLRMEYLERFCLPLYSPDQPPRLVLRNADVHFIREMHIGEDYITTAQVTNFRNTSWSMEQQLWSGGTLRARMNAVVVTLTPDGAARLPLPEALRDAFVTRDGAAS